MKTKGAPDKAHEDYKRSKNKFLTESQMETERRQINKTLRKNWNQVKSVSRPLDDDDFAEGFQIVQSVRETSGDI